MIETVRSTGSTNADLLARIAAGEAVHEGAWLVTDRQVAGRGRQGRSWSDGMGNFMGSTAVKLASGDPPSSSLALLAGVALYHTLAPLVGDRAELMLKWPNDLLLDGAKLSGILLEAGGGMVVIGIGVNLVQAPDLPDRPTIALADLGVDADRDSFASALAESLAQELDRWRTYGVAPMLQRWTMLAHPLGATLRVHDGDGDRIEGTFAGLDDNGALRLRLADGRETSVHAGDVSLERN